MSISISDPLALLPYQAGLITPPLVEGAAQGQDALITTQRAIVLGEPIPIVFCRRVNNVGGVFVSPGATEGRYQNNGTTNALTVNLQLVVSEGDMPQFQERDLYQRNCRVGTWAQTYNRRAGTWTPGNFVTAVTGKIPWNCPVYCGTSGVYTNMTTLSFTNTYQDGDDAWDKQVHVFVREGMQVTRILDNTVGSSNNVVDLAVYLLRQSSRLPESMIDTATMLEAATFTNQNGFFYNGEFKESTNLEDWLQQISTNFLLRFSDTNGKKAFRPRLPYNIDGSIDTTSIAPVFGFTEEHILPNGFQIEYIPLSERKSICALVVWRQQPDSDVGIVRTTEIRFTGEATQGPFEQYDLSQFCTSENHAVKVGTYLVARRKYVTHTLRLQVKPDAYNATLALGDIVRVQLRRETDAFGTTYHDYYYEVERISKGMSGVVELDLIHFPIDSQGRSLLALSVNEATGTGYSLPSGRTDFSCNVNNNTDPIPDTGGNIGGLPDPSNFGYSIPVREEGTPPDGIDNPTDPVVPFDITGATGDDGRPLTGDNLNAIPPCPGGEVCWYRVDKDTGNKTLIRCDILTTGWQDGSTLEITTDDIDYKIYAEARCPDPGSPDGFGSAAGSDTTNYVEPNTSTITYARWYGTITRPSGVTNQTTAWIELNGNFLTVGPVWGCASGVPLTTDDSTTVVPVGPIPWRASVTTTNTDSGSGTYGLGGLGYNGNVNPCSGPVQASLTWSGTVPGNTYSVEGRWQFSFDQQNVFLDWPGRILD